MIYYDFEVWIQPRNGANTYPVAITISPAGPRSGQMQLDISAPETKQLLLNVTSAAECVAAREQFGKMLF